MAPTSSIRVQVAVRDPVTAAGLQAVLSDADGIECLPLSDGVDPEGVDQLRGLVARGRPDVLLMDVAFRREDPRLLLDLAESHPGTRVLVYVNHSSLDCALRHLLASGERARLSPEALARLDDCCLTSLRQRAMGCLGTGVDADVVVRSVRTVHAGEVAAAPWLSVLAGMINAQGPAAISVRELEIMTFLAEGLSNKEIGDRLGIKEQTVKNHVTRTMEKLGVRNRLEVGLLAARHNLTLADDGTPAG